MGGCDERRVAHIQSGVGTVLSIGVRIPLETVIERMTGSNPVLTTKEVDTLYVDDFVRPRHCAPLTKPLFHHSQMANWCHSRFGGCTTLLVMGSTGSNPVLATKVHITLSVRSASQDVSFACCSLEKGISNYRC